MQTNFDGTIAELFLLSDELDPKFSQLENKSIADQNEISDFLHLCEGKIRVFHKLLSTEESRRSVIPLSSSPNSSPKL